MLEESNRYAKVIQKLKENTVNLGKTSRWIWKTSNGPLQLGPIRQKILGKTFDIHWRLATVEEWGGGWRGVKGLGKSRGMMETNSSGVAVEQ